MSDNKIDSKKHDENDDEKNDDKKVKRKRSKSSHHKHKHKHKHKKRSSDEDKSNDDENKSEDNKDDEEDSSDDSENSGDDDNSSDKEKRKHHHKHHKHKHKHRHKHKHKKKSENDDDDDDDDDQEKKNKKYATYAEGITKPSDYNYGGHGIIHESDMYMKKEEFRQWLLEVKKREMETISLKEQKVLFKQYIEDYNTSTFPHEKYYDLEKWEKKLLKAKTDDLSQNKELTQYALLLGAEKGLMTHNDEEELRIRQKMAKGSGKRIEAMQEQAAMKYRSEARELEAMEKIMGAFRKKK